MLQTEEKRPRRDRGNSKFRAAFYRQCRNWHAYLSAFAFVALMFFSATGILLNHPEWFAEDAEPEIATITLSPERLAAVRTAADIPRALVEAIEDEISLRGAVSDAYVEGDSVTIRMQGVKGSSDIFADLQSGTAEIGIQRAGVVTILNELHRGVMSGTVWRLFIDIVAGLILALSLVGYLLFFSLRFRLRTSIALTTLSIAAMVGLFVTFVP
ncbi:PepSY-associated TM helix domain-containing protein [Pannonibacter phragmitetus]|uniref:PepSY-associated TM helix domain-containing protein n=1 Tax=Pannonibacter phragmitetus TaxID=121719 RepID=UPI000F0190B5|nr:PepSY-associated TM helix domain-containing protein [Pannonibacter phragmitetus]